MELSSAAPGTAPAGLMTLRKLLALVPLVFLVWGLAHFPYAAAPLAIGLIVYAALLWKIPYLWMLVLPAILPVLDFGAWSGRFFLTEFDFIILATLAVLYWRCSNGPILPGFLHKPCRLPALFALSVSTSLYIGLLPFPTPDMNSFSSYLSPYNGLRVAKGFFEAWLLLPFLVRACTENPAAAKNRLINGIVTGLALAGIGALWERGVLNDLFHASNRYAVFQSLLDFTGSYRITGLFSGMHVGGTAIDGYLSLTTPLALFPVFYHRTPWVRLASLAAFGLGTYSVMVTFSRGLYAGFGVALLIIAIVQIFNIRRSLEQHWRGTALTVTAFVTATTLMFFLYHFGGYEALVLAILTTLLAAFAGTVTRLKRLWPIALYMTCILIVTWLLYDTMAGNKWSAAPPIVALLLAGFSALALSLLPAFATRTFKNRITPATALIAAILMSSFWVATIPPLSGVRVGERFSTVDKDMGTRENHWNEALTSMPSGWLNKFFGAGAGSYPRYFFSAHLGHIPLANYRFGRDADGPFAEIGPGDFNLMQRVSLRPHQNYTFRLKTRVLNAQDTKQGRLSVKFCLKHILYSERYVPHCQKLFFKFNSSVAWQQMEGHFNSGVLGRDGILYWPPTLLIHNSGSQLLQITGIKLAGTDGRNLIHNGNFEHGSDRWFMVSDFKHLAWHTKNIYLHFYFEQGIFGLATILLLITAAAARLYKSARSGDPAALFLGASLAAFLVVGLFGTVVDMPRVATLFYLILFLAHLSGIGARNQQKRAGLAPKV